MAPRFDVRCGNAQVAGKHFKLLSRISWLGEPKQKGGMNGDENILGEARWRTCVPRSRMTRTPEPRMATGGVAPMQITVFGLLADNHYRRE